jgi:hypothetical protein
LYGVEIVFRTNSLAPGNRIWQTWIALDPT